MCECACFARLCTAATDCAFLPLLFPSAPCHQSVRACCRILPPPMHQFCTAADGPGWFLVVLLKVSHIGCTAADVPCTAVHMYSDSCVLRRVGLMLILRVWRRRASPRFAAGTLRRVWRPRCWRCRLRTSSCRWEVGPLVPWAGPMAGVRGGRWRPACGSLLSIVVVIIAM